MVWQNFHDVICINVVFEFLQLRSGSSLFHILYCGLLRAFISVKDVCDSLFSLVVEKHSQRVRLAVCEYIFFNRGLLKSVVLGDSTKAARACACFIFMDPGAR